MLLVHQTFGSMSTAGTMNNPRWLACELLKNDDAKPSFASDVWSYAMLCLEVFTEKPPFANIKSNWSVFRLVNEGKIPEYPEHNKPHFPLKLWELMKECWRGSPSRRPDMQEVFRRLDDMLDATISKAP